MISVDDLNQQLIFRHPLIRSTVVQLSTGANGARRIARWPTRFSKNLTCMRGISPKRASILMSGLRE